MYKKLTDRELYYVQNYGEIAQSLAAEVTLLRMECKAARALLDDGYLEGADLETRTSYAHAVKITNAAGFVP